ncbi:hypothetical protein K227x_56170 [Rubripirellula lacrimiformis]|uniref:Uncharacterized protein n=1 Tax=Rubripirellula lacrimiformis TaxID=1930273 RepID=A0A517NJ86_9BACT|nr:hypothetical protein K227x_56170 [Rubripirellula lacrimiformis]
MMHVSIREYLRLLRWTSKQIADGIAAKVPDSIPRVFIRCCHKKVDAVPVCADARFYLRQTPETPQNANRGSGYEFAGRKDDRMKGGWPPTASTELTFF